MINFIHKLKHLPEKYMMNSVLENFTILQVTVAERQSQSLPRGFLGSQLVEAKAKAKANVSLEANLVVP